MRSLALVIPILVSGCKQDSVSGQTSPGTDASTETRPDAASPDASVSKADASTGLPITDRIMTSNGELTITPINHATVLLGWGGKHIYLDPTKDGRFEGLPKA